MPKESYRNTKTTPKESSQHPGQGKKMALTIGTLLSSQTTTAHLLERTAPVRGNSQDIIGALGACQLAAAEANRWPDLRAKDPTGAARSSPVCPADTPRSDARSVVNP
jgi:hypothetical protein